MFPSTPRRGRRASGDGAGWVTRGLAVGSEERPEALAGSTQYTSSFPCTYPDHSCTGNKGASRVTRGGNYATSNLTEMCAAHRSSASWQTHYYGIRCARDAGR